MTPLALLRHAPTDWNAARRLQGRADISLSAAAREALRQKKLPAPFATWRALMSPLQRCRETASVLGLAPAIDRRLIEMDWGVYEGRGLDELRAQYGEALSTNEARGLDFRPPQGESPRDVQTRVAPLLAEIANAGAPTLAVTHRGVIRAIYALACGWDMTGEPQDELDLYALHLFTLDAQGLPRVDCLNIALLQSSCPRAS
jgi:broad specificity phosphatase PhoE